MTRAPSSYMARDCWLPMAGSRGFEPHCHCERLVEARNMHLLMDEIGPGCWFTPKPALWFHEVTL